VAPRGRAQHRGPAPLACVQLRTYTNFMVRDPRGPGKARSPAAGPVKFPITKALSAASTQRRFMRCHLKIAPQDLSDLCVSGCALWYRPAQSSAPAQQPSASAQPRLQASARAKTFCSDFHALPSIAGGLRRLSSDSIDLQYRPSPSHVLTCMHAVCNPLMCRKCAISGPKLFAKSC
jgi:hypothetical protein